MLDRTILRAVERLAAVSQNAPDGHLERPWGWRDYDAEGVRFAFFRTFEELRELETWLLAARDERERPLTVAQRALGQYHAAYRDLQAVLLGISDAQAEQALAEGEWPARKVVSHIVQAETAFYVVMQYSLDHHRRGGDLPASVPDEVWDGMVGMAESAFVALLDGTLAGVRGYYQALHARVLTNLAGVNERELRLPTRFWEGEPYSLEFRLHRLESHCRQHTVQIEKGLDQVGRGPNEARRLLRLIYAALAQVEAATIGAWELGAERRKEAADAIRRRAEEIGHLLA